MKLFPIRNQTNSHPKRTHFRTLPALILTLTGIFLLAVVSAGIARTNAAAPADSVDILFLHDTHSHLDSFYTVEDGETVLVGGFARIKTLIGEAKSQNPDTLILDGGDFSMGTLIQTIFSSEASELRMLGYLGCDVTTLGNHEFDYRSQGLASALNAASSSRDPIPAMVLCNLDWKTMEAEGLTPDQQLLKDAFDNYGMADYVMIRKGNLKIAVLGIFGEDSLSCAPTCVLKFRNASEAAAETVARIKANEDADLIVCVSHSGTDPDPAKSEDEILAKNVPELDLIISAHTHSTLTKPIRCGDTYIVSCGSYGRNLGSLSLTRRTDGRWEMADYKLLPVTDSIPEDPDAREKVGSFWELVDTGYLVQFGYTRDQVLAQNDVAFCPSSDLGEIHTDHNLGNILSDALFYSANRFDDGDPHPVDVAIVPAGCVRDTFAQGDITVENVYNAYSLGIGLDGVAGYPLISMYLTGRELKIGAEIDASLSDIMHAARLYITGLHFSFNPHRMILNKVTDCYIADSDGNRVELEDDRLYRVVCDLYSGQMLGAVTDLSYGLLSVQPKFADGTPIENIEDAIITATDGRELKAWAAIAMYLEALADTDGDGIPNVPASYHEPAGHKVAENSQSLWELVKNPNRYAVLIVSVVVLAILVIVLLILLIIRLCKHLRRRKKLS